MYKRQPYSPHLRLPDVVFKPLRSHSHYLSFIECITFYHQYQREVKEEGGVRYIETSLEDISAANVLLKDVLLRKSDELSGGCRSFLERLKGYLKSEGKDSFYGKDVRRGFRMNPHTLKYYLQELQRYGYLKVVGGDRYRSGYEYGLLLSGDYDALSSDVEHGLDVVLKDLKDLKGVVSG